MKGIQVKILQYVSIGIAAMLVGISAICYAQLIEWVQHFYVQWFSAYPYGVSLITPFGFCLAVFLVRTFARDAKGSGIPQVLHAISLAKKPLAISGNLWGICLVSLKTAIIKICSSLTGILVGASIGREGPTIQIAASVFAAVGRSVKKYIPVHFESYLVAGAAAGLAAAFNTPLAGVIFAFEEIADGARGQFRHVIMIAVIVSGITMHFFLGDTLYFGHPQILTPCLDVLPEALMLGLIGGILGGVFAKCVAFPKLIGLPKHWFWRAFLCGSFCSVMTFFSSEDIAGSGYAMTQKILTFSNPEEMAVFFPFLKMATTLFSYLSGMAGGIFSPCLSIGAGMGMGIAKLLHLYHFKACALMGMVAFFSGVVQAPLTAIVIVMEMTDEHILVIPFMVCAFVAQSVGQWFMPTALYRLLAEKYLDS